MIAQFYCEQAEESWRQRDSGRALQFIDTALEVDPKSVRANLMAGRAAEEAGDLPSAVQRYTDLFSSNLATNSFSSSRLSRARPSACPSA